MTLDPETCWRAFAARDRRFDGRFFTGVTTTRIYCRPGCPARRPARANLRFFASAAAAEEAGFRPCLRCRPESAPGSLPWMGTSTTVARALRLIDGGALDEAGVEALASRLGVSGRWLRRLFAEQIGASPLAVARTRRVHFARRLLDQTDLPITDVAFSSGFSSLRRFHHAMRATFRRTPRELRRSAGGSRPSRPHDGVVELRLPARAPFDPAPLLAFLAARAIPGVEEGGARGYRRTVSLGGSRGVLDVRPDAESGGLRLGVTRVETARLIDLVERVIRVFDLRADAALILRELSRDPALATTLRGRRDLRIPGAWDPFELAVRAVLGQQVSVRAAATMASRLAAAHGEPLPGGTNGGLSHLFPTADRLADADLSRLGVTRARAATLQALARAVASGHLDFMALPTLEEAVRRLTELPGIGEWTAHYIAMRALGEPDAFPAGDLGVQRALGLGTSDAHRREGARRAEAWHPWRAYAVMALWTPLEPTRTRKARR